MLEQIEKAYEAYEIQKDAAAIFKSCLIEQSEPRPVKISTEEEYQEYLAQMERYNEYNINHAKYVKMLRDCESLAKNVVAVIPVQQVWFRVGDKAVAKCWDTWGGGHYELRVTNWSNDLPKIEQRYNA